MHVTPEAFAIDARPIPQRRHAPIFAAFMALAAGESFNLPCDHEPHPPHGQFLQRWAIRVRRVAAGNTCRGSGGGG